VNERYVGPEHHVAMLAGRRRDRDRVDVVTGKYRVQVARVVVPGGDDLDVRMRCCQPRVVLGVDVPGAEKRDA
jgi:hypothetical protein